MKTPRKYVRDMSFRDKIRWFVLSPPIFLKVLGIGLLVTVLFVGVTYHQITKGMLRTHFQIHGENALSLATSLASHFEIPFYSGDLSTLDMEITRTMGEFPDVRYIVIQDIQGNILSHGFTFPREAPKDMLENSGDLCAACHTSLSPQDIPTEITEVLLHARLSSGRLRSFQRRDGMILEVSVPIGREGLLRLGVSNKIIAREMSFLKRSLAASLTLCIIVGLSLACLLAYVLVKPIRDLLAAAKNLEKGLFFTRAPIHSHDEIGQLAETFNQMAEGLENYQKKVEEKEAARQMLLRKIVHAQEEERKHVARELHDQLGQMLSKTLLSLDSNCGKCPGSHQHCSEIRDEIRSMIDAVRQLAWNVRPSILDDYGLDRALDRYVKEMGQRVSFELDYQSALPKEMEHVASPEIEVALYRVAQEAITNIIRHADASHASIVLIRRDHEVLLIVEDNGRGFSVQTQSSSKKLGLLGMHERVTLIGGVLIVDSEPGKGTTIRATIPLN